MKNKYFFIGLFIFYIIQFFAPNKPLYFLSYFIAGYFFYLTSKNILTVLIYMLILSFFSEVGIGGSWFLMYPPELNLGSGWWITPMTVIILLTTLLSFRQPVKKINIADIIILIFFAWNTVTLIAYPYTNVFYGIVTLGELILGYFLLRQHVSGKNYPYILYLLISMLIFQSLLGGLQYIFKRNIGIIGESAVFTNPYGLTAPEDINLFRITGGYGHANMYAITLLTLLPFLFSIPRLLFYIGSLAGLLNLFFTYSRAAWVIGFPVYFFLLLKGHFINYRAIIRQHLAVTVSVPVLLFIFLLPSLSARIATLPAAFDDTGSMTNRFKVYKESTSLISQYPLFGVGINRFQEIASGNPVTDIFEVAGIYAGNKVHNLFLELCTEIGIPGLIIFSLFIFFTLHKYYRQKEKTPIQKLSVYGFISLMLISLIHPVYLTTQFRLFFLLAAIILS